ncbi:ankyrin repeat domain-containing protein [Anaeramoeba ignava]|uniref:Ankyrin repeat domain-containing protein n=1 Tax=Anaeramoeba ignava TaxID=1746090 RepID=A0A9Q0RGM2_ANAIG|nr:ankyrin repeat domain-containing protein [Anaeramoeba ignava]
MSRKTEDKEKQLQTAVIESNTKKMKNLLSGGFIKKKVNPNFVTENGETLLHVAVKANSNEKMINLLLTDYNADVNFKDHENQTPLIYAAKNTNLSIETIQLLKEKGADLKHKNNSNEDITIIFLKKSKLNLFSGYIDNYEEHKKETLSTIIDSENQNTMLHQMVYEDNIDGIELFCKNGADLEAKNKDGLTPFWLSVSLDKLDCFQKLYQLNKDLEIDENGNSIIHKISLFKSINIMKNLQKDGLTEKYIEHKNKDKQQTPLNYFCTNTNNDDPEMLRLLHEVGGKFDTVDINGNTPFLNICKRKLPKCLEYFLSELRNDSRAFNFEQKNEDGDNCLHLLTKNFYSDGLLSVLKSGIIIENILNQQNNQNQTPWFLAKTYETIDLKERQNSIDVLEKFGAKKDIFPNSFDLSKIQEIEENLIKNAELKKQKIEDEKQKKVDDNLKENENENENIKTSEKTSEKSDEKSPKEIKEDTQKEPIKEQEKEDSTKAKSKKKDKNELRKEREMKKKMEREKKLLDRQKQKEEKLKQKEKKLLDKQKQKEEKLKQKEEKMKTKQLGAIPRGNSMGKLEDRPKSISSIKTELKKETPKTPRKTETKDEKKETPIKPLSPKMPDQKPIPKKGILQKTQSEMVESQDSQNNLVKAKSFAYKKDEEQKSKEEKSKEEKSKEEKSKEEKSKEKKSKEKKSKDKKSKEKDDVDDVFGNLDTSSEISSSEKSQQVQEDKSDNDDKDENKDKKDEKDKKDKKDEKDKNQNDNQNDNQMNTNQPENKIENVSEIDPAFEDNSFRLKVSVKKIKKIRGGDSYVKVVSNDLSDQTKIFEAKPKQSPSWEDEEFIFVIGDSIEKMKSIGKITFQLFSFDLFEDELVGELSVDPTTLGLSVNNPKTKSFNLTPKKDPKIKPTLDAVFHIYQGKVFPTQTLISDGNSYLVTENIEEPTNLVSFFQETGKLYAFQNKNFFHPIAFDLSNVLGIERDDIQKESFEKDNFALLFTWKQGYEGLKLFELYSTLKAKTELWEQKIIKFIQFASVNTKKK